MFGNSLIKMLIFVEALIPLHNLFTVFGLLSLRQHCAGVVCVPVWIQLLPLMIPHPGNCSKYLSFKPLLYKTGQVTLPSKLRCTSGKTVRINLFTNREFSCTFTSVSGKKWHLQATSSVNTGLLGMKMFHDKQKRGKKHIHSTFHHFISLLGALKRCTSSQTHCCSAQICCLFTKILSWRRRRKGKGGHIG